MIPLFTSKQIADLDRLTMEEEGIDSTRLVERAAAAFVDRYVQQYTPARRVYVFAGFGNNGADALAIARLLLASGYSVYSYLFAPNGQLSPACQAHRDRLVELPFNGLTEIQNSFDPPAIEADAVVLDGLFGTGLSRPLAGGFAALVNYINTLDAEILAIDIPSGLYAEDNSANLNNPIVRANETYTFEQPKLCMLMAESASFVGRFTVLEIGLSSEAKRQLRSNHLLITPDDIRQMLHGRDRFVHKGLLGHGLIAAGSRGMMGAACLAAKAALRAGIGKLTLHVPKSGYEIAQIASPEAMCSQDEDADYILDCPLKHRYNVVGIGPGLGNYPEGEAMLQKLLEQYRDPMVIDADAINMLGIYRNLLPLLPARSILTPHAGELHRLICYCETSYERLAQAKAFAERHSVYLILKGAYSACCMPDGNVVFNATGNAGMATAGSGDVLFGILVGLLAQGYTSAEACILGMYLHGLAADCYVAEESEETLLASDIIASLGRAFQKARN
ncbi:MAG: NAD(P)H-hydrate dehydratase [Porphyromonas sp.]|nr:NAD(P)H-hydrate dehydratase [Porphyromonas sp.]